MALMALWTLAVAAFAPRALRRRMGGTLVALAILAIVTSAPVVARLL